MPLARASALRVETGSESSQTENWVDWMHRAVVREVAEKTGVPTAAHPLDSEILSVAPTRSLEGGDTVTVGDRFRYHVCTDEGELLNGGYGTGGDKNALVTIISPKSTSTGGGTSQ